MANAMAALFDARRYFLDFEVLRVGHLSTVVLVVTWSDDGPVHSRLPPDFGAG